MGAGQAGADRGPRSVELLLAVGPAGRRQKELRRRVQRQKATDHGFKVATSHYDLMDRSGQLFRIPIPPVPDHATPSACTTLR
jgi:hypothetical protein